MFFLLMWPGKSLEFSAEFGGKVKGTGTLCGFNDSSGFTFDIQVNQHLRPDFLIPTCASGLKTRISKTNPSGFWSCGHLQTCMWFLMTICGHLRWMIRPMCELKRWVFNDIESEAYQSLSRSYQTYRQVSLLTVSSQGPCNKKQLKKIH